VNRSANRPSDERVPASYGGVADPVLLSRSRLSAQADSRLLALAVAAAHEYGLRRSSDELAGHA